MNIKVTERERRALSGKGPTKRQIAAAKKYVREHEIEITVHTLCQLLGYTRKVRELESRQAAEKGE